MFQSVPKLYLVPAADAVLAILALFEISKLQKAKEHRGFKSHPLRHILDVWSEDILYRTFRRHSLHPRSEGIFLGAAEFFLPDRCNRDRSP
jgi:hypothetical protein